jgi:NDP-sugar pyrophosphorylase family protein
MNNFPDLTLVIPAKENKKNIEYILKQLKRFKLKKIIILDSKKFDYKNSKDASYYIQKKMDTVAQSLKVYKKLELDSFAFTMPMVLSVLKN